MAKKPKSKLNEWQKKSQLGGICAKCKRQVSLLTVDHIVPASIMDMLDDTGEMKYEREDNFQFLCYPCNKFKGCRLDKTCPKTLQIMNDLLK